MQLDSEKAARPMYKAPTLTVYGSVSELTRQHSNSLTSDAGGNSMAS